MTSDLRDLAVKIEALTREHPAYSKAWGPVQNLSNHLQAMARCEETNKDGPVCRTFRSRDGVEYVINDEAVVKDDTIKWINLP